MIALRTRTLIFLPRDEMASWKRADPVMLRVVRGMLWVTRENDLKDHFLLPGDCLELPAGNHALISAERDADIELLAKPGIADAWRKGKWSWYLVRWPFRSLRCAASATRA